MLRLLLRFLLTLLAARWVVDRLRGGKASRRGRDIPPRGRRNRAESPDLSDLTPWEIEDADYEELPPKA